MGAMGPIPLEEGFVVVPMLWACAWAHLSSCSRILARSTESGQVFVHLCDCVPHRLRLRLNLGLARDRMGPIGRTERSDGRYGSHPFNLLEEGFVVVVVPMLWACAWAHLSSCSRILARSTESGQVFMHLCVPHRLNLT
jgi:hypothetical protein